MMRRTRSLVSRLIEGLSLQVQDYLYDYATPEQQLYKSMIALILRSGKVHRSHAGLAGAVFQHSLFRTKMPFR